MIAREDDWVPPGGAFFVIGTMIRGIAVAALAGALAGAVACGVGARLAMRVTALLASDADQGTLTDAQATVGDVTAGGTIFLVVLGAAVGAIGGLLYMGTRRRLAWAGRWRGVAFGALILATFGAALVEGGNPDFDGLGIPIVNVAMFAMLFVFFGAAIAPVYDNVERVVPSPSTSPAGMLLLVCQSVGVLLLFPAIALAIGILIVGAGHENFVRLVFAAMLVYLLVVMPARFPVRSGAAPLAPATVGPLALPVATGIALDAYELFTIF